MNLTKFFYLSLFLTFLIACDVEKTEEGESPELDVDVEAESGELPEYEVDWANVNVDTRTKTVTVPKLVVVQEEEEVEVPYIDVDMPDQNDSKTERSIMVEAEIRNEMQNIDINKVYASENNLIVVAELTPTGEDLQDKAVRVSDQLVMNVPEDLNFQRYIIGTKPTGEYNNQHTYIGNESELSDQVSDARLIYEKPE